MAKEARVLAIWTAVTLAPALAIAQTPTPAPAAPPGPPTATAPAPAPTDSAAPAPAGSLGGYAWSTTKPAPVQRGYVARRGGPEATLPGFETLADGTTRLFVQLTKNVAVDERKAANTITYVLKGAHIGIWNNTNALVTAFFNTPVLGARLIPHGGDLLFVVVLRANVAPTWKMTPTKDGTAMLQVEFPKGDYLNGGPLPTPAAAAAKAAPIATVVTPAAPAPAPSASATAPR